MVSAKIQWTTKTEVDCYGFAIERKAVGSGNWEQVGFVKGAGSSNSPKSYSYADTKILPGRYAYRLQQIDIDGSKHVVGSTEVEVGVASKRLALLENFPNPFNPTTTFYFSLPNDGRARVKVYNTIGQELATLFDDVAQVGYYYPLTFDGARFASGTYFYTLEFDNQRIVKRMIMMK